MTALTPLDPLEDTVPTLRLERPFIYPKPAYYGDETLQSCLPWKFHHSPQQTKQAGLHLPSTEKSCVADVPVAELNRPSRPGRMHPTTTVKQAMSLLVQFQTTALWSNC